MSRDGTIIGNNGSAWGSGPYTTSCHIPLDRMDPAFIKDLNQLFEEVSILKAENIKLKKMVRELYYPYMDASND